MKTHPILIHILHVIQMRISSLYGRIYLSFNQNKKLEIEAFSALNSFSDHYSYKGSLITIYWKVKNCISVHITGIGKTSRSGYHIFINDGRILNITLTATGIKDRQSKVLNIEQMPTAKQELLFPVFQFLNYHSARIAVEVKKNKIPAKHETINNHNTNLKISKIILLQNTTGVQSALINKSCNLHLTKHYLYILDQIPYSVNDIVMQELIKRRKKQFEIV